MGIKQNQSGFSLLILLIALMGLGGFALANYSQGLYKQVEENRFENNKEVLRKAKEALLMYAYSYPQFNNEGPGRLPCPDTAGLDGVGDLTAASCDLVGRFPWNHPNMRFFEAKDSSNEHLWYAVSDQFHDLPGGPVINSDNLGSISIFDQSGALIYDGSVAGVAAVIIAPGPALDGQDRAADPLDPANYLDSVAGFDNSTFINGNGSTAAGFRLGPVYDSAQRSYVINDQFVVITADEVDDMMEKAVLDTYRDALKAYMDNPGFGVYPWLNAYDKITNLAVYDVDPANGDTDNIGRVPSIFAEYFTDDNSASVESDVSITYNFTITLDEDSTDDMDVFDGVHPSPLNIISGRSAIAFTSTGTGQLNVASDNSAVGSIILATYYFWDDIAVSDGWEVCPSNGHAEADCNRYLAGGFVGDPTTEDNEVPIKVRKVSLKIGFDLGFTLGFDYTGLPAPTLVGPVSNDNAKITANFAGLGAQVSVVSGLIYFAYEQDDLYAAGPANFDPADPVNGSSGYLSVNPAMSLAVNNFRITLDYFPILPAWAINNNWNNSIMLAYSDAFAPGSLAAGCTPNLDDGLDDPLECLLLKNYTANSNSIKALLVASGDHTLINNGAPDFSDDLTSIFEGENAVFPFLVYDRRAPVTVGQSADEIMIVDLP